MKIFRTFIYNVFLLFDKVRIFLHNKFERRVESSETVNVEDLKIFLWKHILKNLRMAENGYYFNSDVKNKNSPMVLSQARVILILSNSAITNNDNLGNFNHTYLIKQLTNYLISMRDNNGLFKFNQASWNLQDEGIASVWSTLAIIRAYEITNDENYLKVAVSTMEAMLRNLYTKETSLIHTSGDYFWCLNSASTFAYACSLLLEYHYSEEIDIAMNDSIKLCTEKLADDGHYPYNLKRQGTYLLLYHPIVILTLEFCLPSKYLDGKIKSKLISKNKKAIEFLINQFDSCNRLFETEIMHYNQYIISNITSLLALKGKVKNEITKQMLHRIAKYLYNDRLYLCMDENDRLYNSDLYKVSDVLGVEVLYWLTFFDSTKDKK
jgi:hypothetical protein